MFSPGEICGQAAGKLESEPPQPCKPSSLTPRLARGEPSECLQASPWWISPPELAHQHKNESDSMTLDCWIKFRGSLHLPGSVALFSMVSEKAGFVAQVLLDGPCRRLALAFQALRDLLFRDRALADNTPVRFRNIHGRAPGSVADFRHRAPDRRVHPSFRIHRFRYGRSAIRRC